MLEKDYDTIYWPGILVEPKKIAADMLVQIDCNFSKLLHLLIVDVVSITAWIIQKKKNFRHYDWYIVVVDNETGEKYGGPPKEEKRTTLDRPDNSVNKTTHGELS